MVWFMVMSGAVVLKCIKEEKPMQFSIPIDGTHVQVSKDTIIHTLWARHQIRAIEEGSSEYHDDAGE